MNGHLRIVGSFLAFALVACGNNANKVPPGSASHPDLSQGPVEFPDGGDVGTDDMYVDPGMINACGDFDPSCLESGLGPDGAKPFPLQSDAMKDPAEIDSGVSRDPNGYLVLGGTHAAFNYLWVANDGENTTSKIDSKTLRETARYSTVTCYSLKTGSEAQCDGTNGCCSLDDYSRWTARVAKQQQPGHQAVQTSSNSPSRTSVDFNGDLYISNRAFGGQPSVTHIANDLADCIDRNHNGKIDTSTDANGNGVIDVNDPKEYFGLKDECILWTTNSLPNGAVGRPLGLGEGAVDSNHSDAWAGSYNTGVFTRIDGTTGLIKAETPPIGNQPYGLAIDAAGYGWAGPLAGGSLCYFDTHNPKNVGCARGSANGYGITLDRDQNVWLGYGVGRYTPDRSNGFKNLGNGFWTNIGTNGIGIAADSRSPMKYYVWSCSNNSVLRIPASDLPLPKGADQTIQPNGWLSIQMSCYGVGVDNDQNIWGVPHSGVITRAITDKNGDVPKQPVAGAPMGNNRCPAGDTCDLTASHYTYSDFTGFGLRNFTRPVGSYSVVVKGCLDDQGVVGDTTWAQAQWDADVPPNSSLIVHVRSGSTPVPDNTWGNWTADANASPLLLGNGALVPNAPDQMGDGYLQIEFVLKSLDHKATPKLKSFDVGFHCKIIP